MYIFFLIFFSNFLISDNIDSLFDGNSKEVHFDILNDATNINANVQSNIEEISQKQRDVIVDFLDMGEMEYSISMAQSYCYSIKDKDGLNDCMSGIQLAKEDISMAQSYCYNIKDKDGLNGCMSGIQLAKEDISMAQSYCYNIKDKDGLNGCMSGVNIIGFFLKKAEEDNSYSRSEVVQIEQNIKQIETELDSDKSEVLAMIRELEACRSEGCLDDPETKELYLQLKGDL